MPPLHRAPLVLVSLLAACMAGPFDAEQQDQAIVGGSLDTGDPEVALLYAGFGDAGGYICSGTLISPRVILTAALPYWSRSPVTSVRSDIAWRLRP